MSRVMLLIKQIRREVKKLLRPNSVSVVRFDSKPVEESTLKGVSVYFALYMICILVIFLVLCLDPYPKTIVEPNMNAFETNMTATVSCVNNIGPGLNLVGPAGNYAFYSPLSKIVLAFAMLLGRLEIFPLLLLFTPTMWKKH